ncbi:MAG: hypothetical protein ACLSVD_19725, partial [Eggerthellaceae bacterium]
MVKKVSYSTLGPTTRVADSEAWAFPGLAPSAGIAAPIARRTARRHLAAFAALLLFEISFMLASYRLSRSKGRAMPSFSMPSEASRALSARSA